MKHRKMNNYAPITLYLDVDDIKYLNENFKISVSAFVRELVENEILRFKYYDNFKEGDNNGKIDKK